MVDVSAETFNKYGIEEHLRTKHTIDEILKWFSDHHYEVMSERINPTSRCNYPDRSVDISDKVMNGLERFAEEYKLTFKKKRKKNVRVRKSLTKPKKQLKVKARAKARARVTHK